MRTRGSRRGAVRLPAAAWALMVALAMPSAVAAQSDCADMISGGPGNPAHGTLLGSASVTLHFGVSAGVTGGFSMTFDVGAYSMSGGGTLYVRCDNYTEFDFQ